MISYDRITFILKRFWLSALVCLFGAGAGTPWARGLGAPGPKMWDARGERNYRLSGRLPTVRQSYLQSGKATYCRAKLPAVRHAPNRSIDLHPTTAYLHPRVSMYMHPTTAYFAPNRFRIHAPNICIHPPKSIRIYAPRFVIF